ncbi:MAG: hypothetical protein EBX95_10320 [Acidimicrobiia bacterium]|nr:hypothetical protein [Acidimicrobiia bacterium]
MHFLGIGYTNAFKIVKIWMAIVFVQCIVIFLHTIRTSHHDQMLIAGLMQTLGLVQEAWHFLAGSCYLDLGKGSFNVLELLVNAQWIFLGIMTMSNAKFIVGIKMFG